MGRLDRDPILSNIINNSKKYLQEGSKYDLIDYLLDTGENIKDILFFLKEDDGGIYREQIEEIEDYIDNNRSSIIKFFNLKHFTECDLFYNLDGAHYIKGQFNTLAKFLTTHELYRLIIDRCGDFKKAMKTIEDAAESDDAKNVVINLYKYDYHREALCKTMDDIKRQSLFKRVNDKITNNDHEMRVELYEKIEKEMELSVIFNLWSLDPNLSFREKYKSMIRRGKYSNKEQLNSDNVFNYDEDHGLFNVLGKGDNEFKLSNFIKSNSKDGFNDEFGLINSIFYMYMDNFCEQEDAYRSSLYRPNDVILANGKNSYEDLFTRELPLDFGKVNLISPNSISKEDCMQKIRNALAHKSYDFIKLMDDEIEIYVYSDDGFKALIEPSFFDGGFHLGLYSTKFKCDTVDYKAKGNEKFVTYEVDGGCNSRLLYKSLGSDFGKIWEKKFKEGVGVNKKVLDFNDDSLKKEKEIIDEIMAKYPGKDKLPWYVLGLLSDNNRAYVHNLFTSVAVCILKEVSENPDITYEMLTREPIIGILADVLNIQSIENKNKIIELCLFMLPDILAVQGLKVFYMNLVDIPERRDTQEAKRLAHFRNAFTHGYYKFIDGKIIIWDYDKNKIQRDPVTNNEIIDPETGEPKRGVLTMEKTIYKIDDLWKEVEDYERTNHSRCNGFNHFKLGRERLSNPI